jgi:hypothetical protein
MIGVRHWPGRGHLFVFLAGTLTHICTAPIKSPRYPQFLCREAERNRLSVFARFLIGVHAPSRLQPSWETTPQGTRDVYPVVSSPWFAASLVSRTYSRPPQGGRSTWLPYRTSGRASHHTHRSRQSLSSGYGGLVTSAVLRAARPPAVFKDLAGAPPQASRAEDPPTDRASVREQYPDHRRDCLCSPARSLPSVRDFHFPGASLASPGFQGHPHLFATHSLGTSAEVPAFGGESLIGVVITGGPLYHPRRLHRRPVALGAEAR